MGVILGTVLSKYVAPTERNTMEQDQTSSASPPIMFIHKVSWKT